METKNCPSGHTATEGQRLCLTCGWIFPVLAGEKIGDYVVASHVTYRGQRYYDVEKEDAHFLIAEFLEFLPRELRGEVYHTLKEDFPETLLDYGHVRLRSLELLYTVYPGNFLKSLNSSLGYRLFSEGLLPEAEVRDILSQWCLFQQRLQREQLCLPAVHLDLLGYADAQLILPVLHLCTPAADTHLFPQKWEGVHALFPSLTGTTLTFHEKLAHAANHTLVAQLVSGLLGEDFYPEPISLKSYRFLLSKGFMSRWEDFENTQNIQHFAHLPTPLYRADAPLVKSVAEANQCYGRGKAFFSDGQLDKALELFEAAREKLRVGPQIPRFIGLCHKSDYSDAYFDALERALREEPLACLYFEQAEGFFATTRMPSALYALDQAIRRQDFFPEAHLLRAQVLAIQGKIVDAETAFRKAIEQRPGAKYYHAYKHFLTQLKRYDEAQALPDFPSTVSRSRITDEKLMLPLAMTCTCPQGHVNSLDVPVCSICQTPLHLAEGETLGEYEVQKVLRLRELQGETLRGAQYLVTRGEAQFFLKEYVIFHRSNTFVKAFEPLTHLEHPHLLPLKACFSHQGFGYLVFPWVPGETLQDHLLEKGALPSQQRATFFIAMLSLLYYFQVQHAVHGDIKPDNILLTESGPLLLDTDSVLLLKHDLPARTPVFSFPYAPPEQEKKELGLTTDPYAFAVTCIYAFTGIAPMFFYDFAQQHFVRWEQRALHLDAYLRQWIKQQLHKNPEGREGVSLEQLKGLLQEAKADTGKPLPETQQEVLKWHRHLRQTNTLEDVETPARQLYKLDASSISLELIAKAYRRHGDWQTALNYLQRAFKVSPGYVRAAWAMADIYKEKGMLKEAIKSYLFSSTYCPGFFGPYLWAARLYEELGETKTAIQMYKQAQEHKPDLYDITFELANLYLKTGQLPNAEQALRSLRENQRFVLNHGERFAVASILAHVLSLQKLYREAIKSLEEALALRPGQLDLRLDMALNAFALRDWEQVKKSLLFILEQNPAHPQALYLMAQTYFETHAFEKARDTLSVLLSKTNWRPIDVRFQLARAYTYLGDLDKAQKIYEALLPYERKPAFYINLANIHLMKKEKGPAFHYLKLAQQMAPENAAVRHTAQVFEKAFS